MKLSIRMLDQRTISLEMQETQDVRALKEQLGSLPEVSLPVESLQLIYSGRIMEDALPLSEYRIAEDKFIVLMGKKAVQVKKAEQPEEQVAPTPPQEVTPSGSPDEQRVLDLMAMGYGEQEVRSALQASFNHPERAIEYLISGIPQEEQAPVEQGLQQLMGDPRVARVREMIRENPELLQLILARLAETDPAAYAAVQSHREEFAGMLLGGEGATSEVEAQVQLTTEELAAVKRLEALGFHRVMAVQAYLACDKNEQLAAEILFRQSEEQEEQEEQEELPRDE
ncbi:UV excision repair protein RAD23 homolog A [Drosophila takahashii]|uniref:UV excision repair protein RAD23 homolog A n=1 Tax=Drosophila takahashii TaxID=29030 RepID=UPI001CF8B015|nr:UV excision repair protein RAD23 homolog B [Drosophila takahashii]